MELARRDIFSYAVVDGYARNFERAGFADEIATLREAHAAGDREAAVAAVSDRMVDAIDVIGDEDTVQATMQAYADGGVDVPVLMPMPWGTDRRALRRAGHPRRGREGVAMELTGKVVLVTGGANGIGRALCERFAAEGAAGIAVVDRTLEGSQVVADGLGGVGLALAADVGIEAEVIAAVGATEARFGPIDLLVCNAGVGSMQGIEAPTEEWQRVWDINVMAHVFATRAVLPGMVARGRATSSPPRPPPGCWPRSATPPTASPSTPPSRSPSGSASPTATSASACRASAPRA